MAGMTASEMAHRRWQNVTAKDRSKHARHAALMRWSRATEADLSEARARAAKAREARTRILAARLLGVDVSKLADVRVEVISSSEFRRQKSQEQAEYWDQMRNQEIARLS